MGVLVRDGRGGDGGDGGDDGDAIITCWCGVSGTFGELFDDAVYHDTCGGTGFLECCCGGDICVCHHHGQEVECPGCADCEGLGRDDPWYDDRAGPWDDDDD